MRILFIIIAVIYSLISRTQVIENPVFDRTDTPQFHIEKIEFREDATIVYCSCSVDSSWANISPETYLEDVTTGEKYTILKSEGLPFVPNQRNFIFAEKYDITLSFPSLKAKNKLNFIENAKEKTFNIYGISLTESNDTIYKKYSVEKAYALSTSANYYSSIKDYNKAIESEKQAMYIRRYWLGRYNENYDHSVYMLGHYYSMLQLYDKAEAYLVEDEQLRKEIYGIESEYYTIALTHLANCYKNQNKLIEAIRLYEKAMTLQEKSIGKNNLSYTRNKNLLSFAYYMIGDLPKAIQCAEDVVNITKELVDEKDEDYLLPLMDLSIFYSYSKINESKTIAKKAASISQQYYGKSSPIYMQAIKLLIVICSVLNDTREALDYLEEVEKLSLEMYGEESVEYAEAMNLKSQLYGLFLHNYDVAIESELSYLKILGPYMSADNYSSSLNCIADYYAKIEDYSNALEYASKSIEIFKEKIMPEFVKMSTEQKYVYWQKRHLIFDSGYPLYVSKCMDKSSLIDLYNNALLFKGITLNDDYKKQCTWEDIMKSLGEKDIAIEFVESIEQDTISCCYALVLKKDYQCPKMFRIIDAKQLEEILTQPNSFHEINKRLGDYIWKSLGEELVDVKNVFFSPSGMFHYLAIEYLPINDTEDYCDRFNFYRLSTTKKLIDKKSTCHYQSAILYGGLDYNDNNERAIADNQERSGFDNLTNTYDEVLAIADVLKHNKVKSSIYSGIEGTEHQFMMLQNMDFDILHLATHGMNVHKENVERMRQENNLLFLQRTPLNAFSYSADALSCSFIVLSGGNRLVSRLINTTNGEDGFLTAQEISKMNFNNLDLVVLSACETAQGDRGSDDSVLGLQRGFKMAGANTILMSLYKVDDEATKIFMVEFYKNLMKGKSKCQSLKEAQRYLRTTRNGKYNYFKYWASFIMLDGIN